MDDWLVDLVDVLLVDDGLVILVDHWLMVFVDYILVYFCYHISVDLMDNVLVMFLHEWFLHMFLDYGCLLVLNKPGLLLHHCHSSRLLVLDHDGLLINPPDKGCKGPVFAGTVLKSVAACSA